MGIGRHAFQAGKQQLLKARPVGAQPLPAHRNADGLSLTEQSGKIGRQRHEGGHGIGRSSHARRRLDRLAKPG